LRRDCRNADHSIFAAKALGSLDAQIVQSLQIMLIDSRDGGAFFCCLNERGEDLSNSDC
jgi:hypothetical protein